MNSRPPEGGQDDSQPTSSLDLCMLQDLMIFAAADGDAKLIAEVADHPDVQKVCDPQAIISRIKASGADQGLRVQEAEEQLGRIEANRKRVSTLVGNRGVRTSTGEVVRSGVGVNLTEATITKTDGSTEVVTVVRAEIGRLLVLNPGEEPKSETAFHTTRTIPLRTVASIS